MKKLNAKAKNVFEEAISIFLDKEKENIENDVAERNLCGRLSLYMENLLPKNGLENYFSDTEYNRKQNGEVKTIINDEFHVVSIQCDLIVHTRGNNIQKDNLIAVEMKKSSRPQSEKDSDRNRLRALTKESYNGVWSANGETHPEHVCGYVLGVYVEINPVNRVCSLEYYEKGERISENTINF